MSMTPRMVLPAKPTVTRAHSETCAAEPSAFVEPPVDPMPSSMLVSVVKLHDAAVVQTGTDFVETDLELPRGAEAGVAKRGLTARSSAKA